MNATTEKMNRDGRELAQVIHDRFGFDAETCVDAARFVVLASEALARCEKKLNKDDKTLSAAGIDFVLSETVKHLGVMKRRSGK